jgi:hypothetical protein
MLVRNLTISLAAVVLAGCGASTPPPADRMAAAQAATRSARELGADQDPRAALHVKLAEEQISQAKALMKKDDNKRADITLQKASADAELAVVLVKEGQATAAASKAKEAAATQKVEK